VPVPSPEAPQDVSRKQIAISRARRTTRTLTRVLRARLRRSGPDFAKPPLCRRTSLRYCWILGLPSPRF
jgi:hypothetical protein